MFVESDPSEPYSDPLVPDVGQALLNKGLADRETLIVVRNPNSRNAAAAGAKLESFGQLRHLVTLETTPDPTENREALEAALREEPEAGVWLSGGDGLQSWGLNALMQARQRLGIETGPALHRPVGLIASGNANDMSHEAYGRDVRNFAAILRKGYGRLLRPLAITTERPGQAPEESRAFAYWSVGHSADSAHVFNDTDHQERVKEIAAKHPRTGKLRQFLQDGRVVAMGVPDIQPLTVSYGTGDSQELLDLAISNGRRMAKVVHFQGMSLFEPVAGVHKTEVSRLHRSRANYLPVGSTVIRALLGAFPTLPQHQSLSFRVETEREAFLTQIDGETVSHPSGTAFTIRLADETIPVLTTV